jgi:hypothetical protein
MPRKMARQTLERHAGACCAGSRPYLGSGLLGSPENRYNLPPLPSSSGESKLNTPPRAARYCRRGDRMTSHWRKTECELNISYSAPVSKYFEYTDINTSLEPVHILPPASDVTCTLV